MVILMATYHPNRWLIAAITLWVITTSAHAKVVIDRYTPTDKFVTNIRVGSVSLWHWARCTSKELQTTFSEDADIPDAMKTKIQNVIVNSNSV